MPTIFLTVSKRAIENMKRRAREAADRGPAKGIIDGPCRASVVKDYLDQINGEHEKRRRRKKTLRKPS
ncbi:hypothetical protein HMPREF9696_03945 [Afipia clevelandensis ATCC 49720]|jgi:hypothetical protein|uniref:Uncharacterized protein n=1 Tax=Afipia clevelandensis ATCC 49720 TaxID=883079 RepID=K8NP61_9BRAD|nr:hypothetical protein HMPREF9696_03945 [Afipia clevelandensis ATCC 49720]